jgi:hypothetical protein
MTCEAPRDCGECDGCTRYSAEHEAKLDQVQIMIEDHIAQMCEQIFGVYSPGCSDDISYAGAQIVNDLESSGWLNLDDVNAAS